MKENQTTSLHKTLRDHSKSMSHACRGGGWTKEVIKCDIGGRAIKAKCIMSPLKNAAINFPIQIDLKYIFTIETSSRSYSSEV